VLGALVLAFLLRKIYVRLQLSLAKHRSLAGHSRMARRFASWVPFYEYGDSRFFGIDAAPEPVVGARRAGFARLSALFAARYRQTLEKTAEMTRSVSDIEYTSR
jgi:glutamate-1-semialdehyde 2,1-aminomutase